MTREYDSFAAFFPYYLREHAKPATRLWHYVGTALVITLFATAVVAMNPFYALAMPVAGYFFAWVSHAFVERNKPATFTYPFWSLVADFKMFFLALSGRLGPHLVAAGVTEPTKKPA
ncbi:MAG: Mpo1-like protein [Parvularcula sp.]